MIAPLVCCVGTTEPWNVAGIGLDSRALAACGARAVTVVVGVSAQDGLGLHRTLAIAPELIAAQFAALERAPLAAIRIGALLDAASVSAVASALDARRSSGRAIPVVYDPVLATSAGGELASSATIEAIARELLPFVTIVTPNVSEARRLVSCGASARATPGREASTSDNGEGDAGARSARGTLADVVSRSDAMSDAIRPLLDSMATWARELTRMGAAAALVTGGHLPGDPIDVFVDARGETHFEAPRIAGELRGTGCLLACALAAELARGAASRDAIATARAFVRDRFAASIEIGGMRAAY